MAHRRLESLKELVLHQDRIGGYQDSDSASTARRWSPAVDFFETDENIVLNAELPGMEEDAIDIEISSSYITIKGARKFRGMGQDEDFLCVERNYGNFKRSFQIPARIIREKAKAEFKLGVLKLTIPKRREPAERLIKVTIG